MHSETFEIELITPMFLHGADGVTPELRPPSFKGVLRFWWRAVKVLPISDLQRQEAQLFGSSGEIATNSGKSPLAIRIQNSNLKWSKHKPVPHKNFKLKAFDPNQNFKLKIIFQNNLISNQVQEIISSVKIMVYLGGIGQRARRGLGSIGFLKIEDIQHNSANNPLEIICEQLQNINSNYSLEENKKIVFNGEDTPSYPWIKSIELGAPSDSWQNVVLKISKAAHNYNSQFTGNAIGQRFASPIYVSVWKSSFGQYYPIVTTLNLPSSTKNKLGGSDKRKPFKEAILNGE